jgi:hypothetical protein
MTTNPYESPQSSGSFVRQVMTAPPISPQLRVAIISVQLAIGLIAGYMIWAVAAPREAWDVNPFYSVCIFSAGLFAALLRPCSFYWGVIGIYLGQVAALYFLIPLQSAILPPALAVLLLGTPQAFAGGLLGAVVGFGVQRLIRVFGP